MLRRLHQKYYDLLAILASITCAVHCAALPILASLSASSAMFKDHSHGFDNVILFIAVVFAYKSLWKSYQKRGNITFLSIATLGFVLIICGRFGAPVIEISLSILGGLSIAIAHFLHMRMQIQEKTQAS